MYEEDNDENFDFEQDESLNDTTPSEEYLNDDDIVNGSKIDDDIVSNHNESSDDIRDSDEIMLHNNKGEAISFGAHGWDCRCSGSCLCRYYEPQGTYNTDCMYCGHPLSWHRKR